MMIITHYKLKKVYKNLVAELQADQITTAAVGLLLDEMDDVRYCYDRTVRIKQQLQMLPQTYVDDCKRLNSKPSQRLVAQLTQ